MSSSETVPLIDVSEARSGRSAQARHETAAMIGQACERSGFFAVTGHGIPAHVIETMYAATRDLFRLPESGKHPLAADPLDPLRRGMSSRAAVARSNDPGSRLAAPAGGPAAARTAEDLCETFSICVASETAGATSGNPVSGRPNLWPAQPHIRSAWVHYADALAHLAGDLMGLFAVALGLPGSWFDDKIDQDISSLTANHYPAQDVPPPPGQIRKGEHTDWGSLTLLYQDAAAGGLQVLGFDRQWHDVPAIEGTFIVNIGDLMSRWTNDSWVSTAHRVVNPPRAQAASERFSIAYFHQPNFDATIRCIPTCLRPGQSPRYEPVTSGQYLLDKVARMHAVAG